MTSDGRISEADYLYVRGFLREQIGYDLGAGKEYLVEGRLGPVAATFGLPNIARLLDQLRLADNRSVRDAVIEAMAINETYFFRAPAVFDTLRTRVLPALLAARKSARRLRIWCAACSTGQEPFSIAMLLADHFPELAGWSTYLLATDISEQSLDRARSGLYSQFEVQRGLSVHLLLKHFTKNHEQWQIADSLRRAITWRKINLLDSYLGIGGPFDLILIRNALIYFDRSLISTVFAKLAQAIAQDGFLILGESETVMGLTDRFVCSALPGVYSRANRVP